MTQKLQYPTCRQLLDDSRFCPNPALHGKSFCRHHSHERQRLRNLAKARQLKEYTQPKRAAADPNFRPDEELNGAIFDAMRFPTLDTTAAIAVAASNVARLLGAGHLSARAAHVMASLIRIAEINLRQGHAFAATYNMPAGAQAVDNDPVPVFGDDEGFVLPEENNLKRLHDDAKRELPADVLNETRASLGLMPAVIDELDPKYAHLPPAERGRAAYRDLRAAINAGKGTPSGVPSPALPKSALAAEVTAQAEEPVPPPGTARVYPCVTDDKTDGALALGSLDRPRKGTPSGLPQTFSEGHDFSRAVKDRAEGAHRAAAGLSTSKAAPAGEPVPPLTGNRKPETGNHPRTPGAKAPDRKESQRTDESVLYPKEVKAG